MTTFPILLRKFNEAQAAQIPVASVSSCKFGLLGTCLAAEGTEERFPTKDATFTLNPELFNGNSMDEPDSFVDYDTAKGYVRGFIDWNTGKALDLLFEGDEFGVNEAKRLGIITKAIELEDVVEDHDCTESWEDIHISSFWGF